MRQNNFRFEIDCQDFILLGEPHKAQYQGRTYLLLTSFLNNARSVNYDEPYEEDILEQHTIENIFIFAGFCPTLKCNNKLFSLTG